MRFFIVLIFSLFEFALALFDFFIVKLIECALTCCGFVRCSPFKISSDMFPLSESPFPFLFLMILRPLLRI